MEDKAREYAIDSLKDQIDIVAAAYRKGFDDALRLFPEPVNDDNGLPMVSMGLPSGTLWMNTVKRGGANKFSNIPCHFSYGEALKYNIPTVEEFEELLSYCKYKEKGYFLACNGNSVQCGISPDFHVWVKSDVKDDNALAYEFKGNNPPKLVRMFTGERILILVTKKKD